MPCHTCDHTAQKIGVLPPPQTEVPVFWCPRCGTLRANVITEIEAMPSLVRRVRDLVGDASENRPQLKEDLHRRGITESVYVYTALGDPDTQEEP